MLVRCPQCQFANQVEADAAKPRIVCARCATVISIEFLASPRVPSVAESPFSDLPDADVPLTDLFAERRPPEPSFMKTPESPLDLDSLLEPSPEPSVAAAPATPLPPPPPVLMTPALQDPLPESRWESDEILDIPRAATEPQPDPLAVDDLLAPAPLEPDLFAPSAAEPLEPLFSEPAPVLETHAASATDSIWGTSEPEAISTPASPFAEAPPSPFAPEEYVTEEHGKEQYAEAAAGHDAAAPASSVFAQDSYTRTPGSTYVMATPDGSNKGWLAKLFLVAALLFALLGVGYWSLSGLIKDWLGSRRNQQIATNGQTSGQSGATTGKPGATPSVAPSLGTKPGADGKTATASPAASASAKTAATATPSPAANQNVTKPTPTPPAASTGSSGHALGSGDGSLTIQVAAYRTPAEAQQAIGKLKSAGVEARMIKAEVAGKGTYYRVQAGRFTSEAEASKFAGELRAKGAIRDFIVAGYQAQ